MTLQHEAPFRNEVQLGAIGPIDLMLALLFGVNF